MQQRRGRPTWGIAIGLALVAGVAWAGPATEQVKASVDRVLAIVQDPELRKPDNTEKRRAELRSVARGLFDFEEMGKRALARHWSARSPQERKHFTELFADLLEASYVSKIESYGGEEILYLPEQATSDLVTVRSKVITKGGTEVPIDYRMRQTNGRWEVFDVLIEGVSLVSTYRTQFNKIIIQSSYEELVKKLELKQVEVEEEIRSRKSGS